MGMPAMSMRRRILFSFVIILLCSSVVGLPTTTRAADDDVLSPTAARQLFAAKVQPLLKKKCLGCHGDGKTLESNFDMRTREGLLRGGELGLALIPGKPEKSEIYQTVLRTGNLVMPPKERNKLTVDEIAVIKKWIAAGAPWADASVPPQETPKTNEDGVIVKTSGGLSTDWTNRRYKPEDVWAYRPILRPSVPWDDVDRKNVTHPIDAFIQSKLKSYGFSPALPTKRLSLLRRATFDLTGLPPTPQQIDTFLDDQSPDAFEKVIDRLLQNKHYGEQQARHWLDVVRYADTAGFSNDYERPNAWRYRDWVVRSFNADKPYDRFIIEQIAGDELDPRDPRMLIAVGFLRMGPWEHTGMSVAAVTRQQFLDDVTHSVGVTFLAQGMRCAKCHDHKFDPLPTKDYYRLQACFAPVQFADRRVEYLPQENIAGFQATKARTERLLTESQQVLEKIRKKNREALTAHLKKRGVKNFNELPLEERGNSRFFGLSSLEKSFIKIHGKRVSYFQRELKRYESFAFSLYNGPANRFTSNKAVQAMPSPEKRQDPLEVVHILTGGSIQTPAQKVTPGILSAMTGSNDTIAANAWNTIPSTAEGRRLALAKWIASPNNTLTARVIVNRIWQQHFGKGIVATPNSFGKMGSRPTHPELLDWLATWFIEHGWSIKKLHRLILTSDTYRQSSHHGDVKKLRQIDPNNDLLAYASPRRLAAEEIRDSMLALTGELNPEMGGPGIFPEINWEVAMQPRHIMGSVAPAYQPSPLPRQRNRRTIYAFRFRTLPDPMLEVFNRPGSDISCERRDETTVTPQVFALFNGQFVHDRALALAIRVEKLAERPAEQIDRVFRVIYGRKPTAEQRQVCLAHVQEMTKHHRRHKPKAISLLTSVKRQMVEELTGEPFEWEEELDVMKNYQRDKKPWDVGPEARALAELCLVLLNSSEFLYLR